MNYTQTQATLALLKEAKRKRTKQQYEELQRTVNKKKEFLYAKRKDGKWGLTSSDLEYAQTLSRISQWCAQDQSADGLRQIEKVVQDTASPLKIVFFTQEYSVWPTLQPIYERCMEDKNVFAQLVHVPFLNPDKVNQIEEERVCYRQKGYPIIFAENYDLAKESPDIAFFLKPYDLIPVPFSVGQVTKAGVRCVYAPYGFYAAQGKEFTAYACSLPMQTAAWFVLADGKKHAHDLKQYGYRNGENVLCSGNPRADLLRRPAQLPPRPEEWDKLKGKKVALYNTHFTVEETKGFGTFMEFGEKLFAWFGKNPDLGLIWRPHPLLHQHLIRQGLFSQQEWDELVARLDRTENIVVDIGADYLPSFYYSDAIISDGTSFLNEYLFTERPVCYTRKQNSSDCFNDAKLLECYTIADRFEQIEAFLEDLRTGADPQKEKRMQLVREEFWGVDESVSERVLKTVKDRLMEEESRV